MSFIETAAEPPEDLVEGLIPGGNPRIMIAGPPGSLKTFAVEEIMRAVSRGDCAFGRWRAQKGAVCIIEEEHHAGNFAKRLRKSGIDLDLLTVGHKTGLKLRRNSLDVHNLCRALRDDPNYRYRVLVLDPFAEFHDKDEENAQEMAEVLDCLNMISAANPNCALVVIHHTTKASWNRGAGMANARGSSRLAGSFDVLYEVTPQRVPERHLRQAILTCHKNKDGEAIDPVLLQLDFSTETYSWSWAEAPARKGKGRKVVEDTSSTPIPILGSTSSSTDPQVDQSEKVDAARQIIEMLRNGQFGSVNDVAKHASIRRAVVYATMKDLQTEKLVSKAGGIFTLREDLR